VWHPPTLAPEHVRVLCVEFNPRYEDLEPALVGKAARMRK
jgi:hypothetical protein